MLKTQDQISIELPTTIRLYVNDEQFAELARVNRDLRLEKTASGELIVNPPTGGESGRRNFSLTQCFNFRVVRFVLLMLLG